MFIRRFARNLTVAALFLLAGLPALAQHHSADTTPDQQILLSESLRAVQLFNSGGFHCMAGTEDGYAPGPDAAQQTCAPHDSDYLPRDWSVNLTEPLRVIQFFNTGGYHTECGPEDDFAPGMGGLFACSAAGEGQPAGVVEGEGQSADEETILLPGGVALEMVRIPAGSFQWARRTRSAAAGAAKGRFTP